MAHRAELPDIAEVVGGILRRVSRARQPVLLAQRERVAAARYRGWADTIGDPGQRDAFLACADREEEIARRVEALYPAAASIQQEILAKNPDLASFTGSLFAAYPLDQQFVLQARGERFGAATWRAFAEDEPNPAAQKVFLECARLEEESAAFLESLPGVASGRPSPVLTKVTITKKMTVPSDRAWAAISKIGRLDVWFPGIATCRVEGDGVGAHRYLTLHRGGDITDRIVDIDPTRRRLTYQRVKSPFPVTSYRGTVEVFESFDSRAVVVWTVDFESDPEDSASVAERLEAGIGAGVDGMEKDLQRPET